MSRHSQVFSDLRNRGVQDILIAVVDGLMGFPLAIEAAFPQTRIQTCIVHLLRHSMNFASYKVRKAVAAALKAIHTAVDAHAADLALAEFEDSDLARRYPAIAPSWRRAWNEVIPFLGCTGGVELVQECDTDVDSGGLSVRVAGGGALCEVIGPAFVACIRHALIPEVTPGTAIIVGNLATDRNREAAPPRRAGALGRNPWEIVRGGRRRPD